MTEAAKQQFAIQKVYVKDISFETPNSPRVFLEKWEPEVGLQLSNAAAILGENTHEVTLTLTVTAKLGEQVAYLVEVKEAGIFTIEGYDEQQLAAMVGSYCPHILFPYARETISDLVARGGFPQLILAPINFDVLYRQHLDQAAAGQAGEKKH